MGAAKDYWVLGIPPGSDEKAIKDAFRKEAMKWHPDKWANAPGSAQNSAATKYQAIQDAYKRLTSEAASAQQQNAYGTHAGYNKHDFDHEMEERNSKFQKVLYGGAAIVGAYYLFSGSPLDDYDEEKHKQIIEDRDRRKANSPKKHDAEKIKVDFLVDGAYTDNLRAMSMSTGAKPIRTGYGWDWTPVKKAYDDSLNTTVKKAGQQYIEEELAGPAWEKQLQKKIDKIKRKKARRRERKEKEAAQKAREKEMENLTERFAELEQRFEQQQRENAELKAKLNALRKT